MRLVYALATGAPASDLPVGICGEPLSVVTSSGIAAIAGEVTDDPTRDETTLRAYDALLRDLAARHESLLPSRFGVVVPDDEALAAILDARADELLSSLELVRGREQMTLRVFGEPSTTTTPAVAESLGPGARYLHARKAANDHARALPEIEPLRIALADLVRAERITRHDAAPLLATVAHLIDRGRADDYRAAVAAVSLDVRLAVTGPWPAYGFAPEASA